MKLSNKYGGLQFFAVPAIASVTMNFDSNVTKVIGLAFGSTSDTNLEWTTSGTTQRSSAYDGTTYTFNVTLASGYIIDKVTLSDPDTAAGKLVSTSDTSFKILAGSGGVGQTITITSKQSGGGTVSETWVLNETIDIATGKNIPGTFGKNFKLNVGNFTCNGASYVCFAFDWDGNSSTTGGKAFGVSNSTDDNSYTETYTDPDYMGSGWKNQAYRTIIFETAPTGDLLTWLQANGTKQSSTNRISVDLATAFPDKWAALDPGEHTIQIRAKNPGNYLDSDLSTAITFTKVVNWTINITATNCTADASNPTVVPSNTTAANPVVLKFNKVTGYKLPTSLILDGIADDGYTWSVSSDGTVGTITIVDPSGNITGTVAGTVETYNITVNGTHASKASGPSTITYGGSATLTFTYEDGYFAPTDVTVTGASKQWLASTNTLQLLNCTGPVTVDITAITKTYTITPKLTNCTWNGQNPTTIASNQFTPIELDIVKNTGWTLPTEISVSGVDAEYWSWNQATGTVTISHPQGDVTVTVDAVREVYNITTNLTHALAGTSNPTTIGYGLSATLTFTFLTGYEAPASVEVTGATQNWTSGTGTLVLSNPTGNVTVTVVGVATSTTLDGGTYKWLDNINLAEWTQDINFTSDGTSYNAMRYTGDGTAMTLQYKDADSEWVTVYNYDEDTSTGSWVNDNYKIVDLGTSAQTVTAIFKADFIANTTKLTQLAAPQNVTADGTNVSWDEVENATSYEVIEGGNNVLGIYTPTYTVEVNYSIKQTNNGIGNGIMVYDGGEGGTKLFSKNGTQNQTITGQYTATITTGIISIGDWSGERTDLNENITPGEGLAYVETWFDPNVADCFINAYRVTKNTSISITIAQT